jgi:type I restriction enzyme R subunit
VSPSPDLNEAVTRAKLIDPALQRAGWDTSNPQQVGKEIPVDGSSPAAWQRLRTKLQTVQEGGATYNVKPAELPSGISDYVLYRANGEIIAVVEAKRTSIDPRLAEAQADFYAAEIAQGQSFRPFAFTSNGRSIHLLDGESGMRPVQGFFSLTDLERLLYLRQNRQPLSQTPINPAIVDRLYQQQAVRQVAEAFEAGKRRALLVMATGTGKTRTAMALVDLFLKADQARHILFVADRDALVEQALEEGFKAHIEEPATRIYAQHVETAKNHRLYTVTLQTISQCFRQFTPGFFDLIIFDEVHRSIFNKWNEVLNYFDARIIGLTATPATFIDRNTFLEFHCFDNKPTFLYSYEEAIKEGYLVDFSLYKAQTGFQRKGIKGAELSEEARNTLIQSGIDPDEMDYKGTDLEKKVSNKGTLRAQWQEIIEQCYKDQSGQLPGKMIVFAVSQDHALRLQEAFGEAFPQYANQLQVITYKSDHHRTLIKTFKRESQPRIAVSVDMLETGVNVPEAVNLVFMRPIHSQIRLNQMLGRGTRTHESCKNPEWLPGGYKDDFLIIDFWENDFNKEPDTGVSQSLPVLVTIFNTRLDILEALLGEPQADATQKVINDLRAQIAQIPTDSHAVEQVWPTIEAAWEDHFWLYLTRSKLDLLRGHVGPLLRFVPKVDLAGATFTSKVERLKLQTLTGKNTQATATLIAEDVSRLPSFVYNDPNSETARAFHFGLQPQQLQNATPEQLDHLVEHLAGLMKKRAKRSIDPLIIDLQDEIDNRGFVIITARNQPMYIEEYRQRVDERILELVAGHPTIAAIEQGQPVSDAQLLALERTLVEQLGHSDLLVTPQNIRRAYQFKVDSLLDFTRQLLELDSLPNYESIVKRQFSDYMQSHTFNAEQLNFLRAVQGVFLQRRHLQAADLYESPFDSFGDDAVERWFTDQQIDEMMTFVQGLTIR